MKRLILIFFSILLMISLVGCGSTKSTQAVSTNLNKAEDKVTNETKTEQNDKEDVKPPTVTISTDKVIEVPKKEEVKPTPTETKKPDTSSTTQKATTPKPSTPTPTPVVTTPVSNLKVAKSSEQLIVITTKNTSSYSAVCNVYEKVNGEWKYVWKSLYAVTGLKGVSYNRHEGDNTTPAGVFTLTQAFGIAGNPGTKMPYRVVQSDDWWAGDSQDPKTYNTWQKAPSTGWRESESEHLIDVPIYKYAMVIDFNTERTPYKGSAIFFHIAPYSGRGTAGCVGIKENDLVNVLRWINPSKNPKIIICPEWDLNKF